MIRAAYVALMRLYHPDKNHDPAAQARVREITNAFSVLSNPQTRAAYDAMGTLRREMGIGKDGEFEHRPPPMRNLGLASVGLAVVVSLAFSVWPKSEPAPGPQVLHSAAVKSNKPAVASPPMAVTEQQALAQPVVSTPTLSPQTNPRSAFPQVPARKVVSAQPEAHVPTPKRAIAMMLAPKPAAPAQFAANQAPVAAPARPAAIGCPTGSYSASNGQCTNDRRAQIERIATSFLKQSMDHADWQKQQLLQTASARAAESRAACRSDDCVAGAYLRQIRDTSAIMEGRNPGQ